MQISPLHTVALKAQQATYAASRANKTSSNAQGKHQGQHLYSDQVNERVQIYDFCLGASRCRLVLLEYMDGKEKILMSREC